MISRILAGIIIGFIVYLTSYLCNLIMDADAYLNSEEHNEMTKARRQRIERRTINNEDYSDL